MGRLKDFIRTSLIGGIVVVLPVAIFAFIFQWLFSWIADLIQPLTNLVMQQVPLQKLFAEVIVVALILTACFLIGVSVKTRVGKFIHENLEKHILKIAPGYNTIKETVMQFLGNKEAPFSSVALVQVFENNTLMTGFITDTHPDGYTVFVPTGPNPTSGNIFHLKAQYVHPVDTSIEKGMRSIISCGAGSASLIHAYAQANSKVTKIKQDNTQLNSETQSNQ